jgi:hypothetical protein
MTHIGKLSRRVGFGAVLLGLLGPVACGDDPVAATKPPAPSLGESGSRSQAASFADTPASAERVELTLEEFDLAPGGEIYKCQNFQNPFGKDVAILQTQSIMSHGSHHLAVFRIAESADAALENCSGLEFHATVHAAQTPVARSQFPEGVGAFLAGTEGLRLNAHYFNLSNETIHAQVRVALDAVSVDEVEYTAAQIYLNDSTLNVPPGKGTGGGTMALPAGVSGIKLLSTQSHMHRRGVKFQATLDDGTSLYEADTWSEPPVKTYDPPLPLRDGANITWRCDYENETANHLNFGESADTNEMCVLTGFYYPAPDGKMIVGDLSGGGTAKLLK